MDEKVSADDVHGRGTDAADAALTTDVGTDAVSDGQSGKKPVKKHRKKKKSLGD